VAGLFYHGHTLLFFFDLSQEQKSATFQYQLEGLLYRPGSRGSALGSHMNADIQYNSTDIMDLGMIDHRLVGSNVRAN